MRGVGPGTVLGGRYTVHRRLAQDRGTERWSADDTTLGRRVSVLVVPADDHRVASFLDAARRAGSVSHAVLVRILDVGQDDGLAYVVEEELADAHTLADLVAAGGVPGDEVRRITGEVAAALESARQRGMHHLDLTPDDVLRTPDGEVRLRGLEIAAVRAGEDGLEPEEAARRDAEAGLALAYAALTGLGPLGSGGSRLTPAPRVPGGVAAPSEIAAGVPRDLDAICRLTLNEDQGPTSPGDYARQVAPWPSRQVVSRPVLPAAGPRPPSETAAARDADAPSVPAATADRAVGGAPVGAALAAAGAGAAVGAATRATAGPTGGAASPAPPPPLPDPSSLPDPEPDDEPDDEADDEPTAVIPRTPPPARLTEDDTVPSSDDRADPTTDGGRTTALAVPEERAVTPPDEDDESSGPGTAVLEAMTSVGSAVSSFARRAVDRVTELSPDTQRAEGDDDDLDAPAPLVPAEPLTHDESKLAIGIVVAFLVLALAVGIYGVRQIGSNSDLGLGGPSPSSSASPSPSASASSTASASAAEDAPSPLAILKVSAYDPLGDNNENDQLTPKTYDGDPSTGWNSERYRSDDFGGLKKGVGLIVDLGPNKKPQDVKLVVPSPVDVEVYVNDEPTLEAATKIGAKTDAKGTLDFPVPDKVAGQYIVLWYTGLHVDSKGNRRAWLNEVVVSG